MVDRISLAFSVSKRVIFEVYKIVYSIKQQILSLKNKLESFKLQSDEEVLWEGKYFPLEEKENPSILITFLDFIDYLRRLFIVGLIILLIYLYIMSSFTENELLPFIIYVVAYTLFNLFLFLYNRKRKNSKFYIITNCRVVFLEWKIWSGSKSYSAWLENIDKITYEEFDNDISTIYLMGVSLGDYKNTEFYPALVQIKKGREVYNLLLKLIGRA